MIGEILNPDTIKINSVMLNIKRQQAALIKITKIQRQTWNIFFNRDVMAGKYTVNLSTTMIAGEYRPDYLCRLAADSAAGDGSLQSNRQS